jgi:hypothetical protein
MIINSSHIYAKLNILNDCSNIIETDAFWQYMYLGRCRRWLWVSLVEQELLTLPEHMSSLPVFSGVRATRSLVLYVCFVDRCFSFCTFSFCHCILCFSSIYWFWSPFGIFKLFLKGHFLPKSYFFVIHKIYQIWLMP